MSHIEADAPKTWDYLMDHKEFFPEGKVPFTKKVLERIDFHKILRSIQTAELMDMEKQLGLQEYFQEHMLADFKRLPELSQESLMMYI